MRFLADMGVSPAACSHLRAMGHDAVHVHERGLARASDAEILEVARVEGRVVLTHDLDFGDLLAASGAFLPSVIIFRLPNMRPDTVSRYLRLVLQGYEVELAKGAIVSVGESRVRLRLLPIR